MKCGHDSSSSYLRYDDVKITILVIHIILLLFGILGNTAVIFYNIFLNHNKTSSSRLITHLAFADLLVCLILYSAQITKFLAKDEHEREILCPLRVTALHFSLFLSVMILLSITVEKYLYIAKPLKYPLIVTRRRTSILLICIWLAAIVQLPLTQHYGIGKGEKHEKKPCHPQRSVILFNIIVQLVAIFIITILNFKMFKIVKEQRLRIASEAIILQPIRQKTKQIQFEEVETEHEKSSQVKMEQTQSKQAEMEQIQSEQAEMGQIQSEQAEMEQIQSEQAEMEQIQSKQAEMEQIQSEQAEMKQIQSEQAEMEQIQSEQADMKQIQSEQAEMEQIQSEQAEMEQIQSEQAEMEQVQSEQAEMEQIQSNKVDTEQDQSEEKQSGQVPLQQIQSEQPQLEHVQAEQVPSNSRMTWLRHLLVEMKAVKTFTIIVAVLICCLVPFNFINIIKYILDHGQHWTHKARWIAYELVGINSIVNAYVYALRHKKYIRAFKQLFSAAWARIMSSMDR